METSNARSIKSAVQLTSSDVMIKEAYAAALARNIQDTFKREYEFPTQGEQFFRMKSTKFDTGTVQSFRDGAGVIPMNADTEEMNSLVGGDGFSNTYATYTYRRKIDTERKLEEIDDRGVITGRQKSLVRASRLTLEYAWADVFNRGIYVDSNSRFPILADDGCPLISDSRNNPNPAGSTWSNLESASAISETSLFTASLAARQMTDEDGILFPTKIMKIVVPSAQQKNIWKVLETERELNSANWNRNWANDAFSVKDVIVYDWLTSSYIFYVLSDPKGEDNELVHYWRIKPNIVTYAGSNPDVLHQRLRMDWGLFLGSPRKAWRGGVVS